MSDEDKSGLAALQKRIRDRLREGMSRVERLEETTTPEDLEKWMGSEIKRYGGRKVELEDE